MPKFAFALPVLPGKDARSVSRLLQARMSEYEESRRRAGVTMERAYEQPTPMGTFAVGYIEAERDFAQTMGAYLTSGLPIDTDLFAALEDVHGFDASQPPPAPEVVADWWDPEVKERRRGVAFTAPLLPGRTEAARAFATEAFVRRRDELTASRRALGNNGEVVILNSTPHGDLVCIYLEGHDPVEANRRFAASQLPYDVWFKQELKSVFPPEIDFNQPVPPVEQIWDWQRAPVRA